ncbi:DNA-3-methyladenine glycosylase [Actinopolyspora mortivallis]|uniref:DNA-3-methyladenine glycosylase n=1 Tax=Actinopolyspora mortivallis TaxID=33906 RepID=A0A2T0H0I4_ACTMO|nr:DNA-3-methyladenine glycosylase [Actinopolyspora mortivallis]
MSDFRQCSPTGSGRIGDVLVTTEQAYRAVASRDPRFDGCFVTAVRSTGIYCLPSCPARTPKTDNIAFFPTTAAAQQAGYRACKRCLPDAVPGSPEWNLRADLAGRAVRLIDDGTVDREGVGGLAARLGYSPRHLNRVLTEELGAGPLALARAHRAHTARLLIERTGLAFGDIAHAAGFASLRQFNDTVREVFAATPTELRRATRRPSTAGLPAGTLRLRLPARVPFDGPGTLRRLTARAVPGVEWGSTGHYGRTLRLPHGTGTVELTPAPAHVAATLHLTDLRDLGSAVNRLRRLLDLDCDPVAVDETLGRDPFLAEAVAGAPGTRMLGSVDGAETALRAVLRQQLSPRQARLRAGWWAAELGETVATAEGGTARLFPTPRQLVEQAAHLFPTAADEPVRELAERLAEGQLRLHPGREGTELRAELRSVPGLTARTAERISTRVLGEPDTLVLTDAVLRGARRSGLPTEADRLERHAHAWSPWRSYAAEHLRGIAESTETSAPDAPRPDTATPSDEHRPREGKTT